MKNNSNNNTQQILPFVDLTTVDGRNDVRKISKKRAERLHLIDIDNIRLRPGLNRKYFNWRIQKEGESDELYEIRLGIPQLAEAIYKSNGPDDNPVGDIKDGLFYINGGERRFRALRYLLNKYGEKTTYPNGEPVRLVEVLQNPKDFTDKDRIRRIHSSDSNLKYSPMERAWGYQEMKDDYNMTNQEIADELQISRQTVDNYIKATTLPPEVQNEVDEGKISLAAALTDLRTKNRIAGDNPDEPILINEKKANDEKTANDRLRGDEEEFEQEDNSVTGMSSKGGPKEDRSSGEHVVGKDSIYKDQEKLALWKQFVHRYEKVKTDIMDGNRSTKAWEDELAEQLKNEYNLTVK